MPSILKSIDIEASPDNVFNYVTNVSTQPDWIKFLKAVDITSGDGQTKGTTDRCVIKLGARAQEMEALWTEYDPPRVFARKATSGMEMDGRMTFEPRDDGTHVAWKIGYRPPMGALGVRVAVLFRNRVSQNHIHESSESRQPHLDGELAPPHPHPA